MTHLGFAIFVVDLDKQFVDLLDFGVLQILVDTLGLNLTETVESCWREIVAQASFSEQNVDSAEQNSSEIDQYSGTAVDSAC